MESSIKGLFRFKWQPLLQLIRFKTKVNITKPRPPHFERALMETLCLPYFSKKKPQHIPNFKSCGGQKLLRFSNFEDHPLLKILAEENFSYFSNAKLIAFFHINFMNSEDKFELKLLMKKNGMKLLFLNKMTVKKALTGTTFENVLVLYEAPTAAAFGSEPNINKLMKISEKSQKLILMGAIIENRLLSLTELRRYKKLKNITEARLNLVSVFNSFSQHLIQQINYQPSKLVGLLNQHKKVLETNKK